jgi:hypothetical protein
LSNDAAIGLLVLAVIVAPLIYVTLRDRRRNQRNAQQLVDARPPRELLDALVFHMAQKGYTVAAREDSTTTFTRQRRRSMQTSVAMAVLALLSLFLMPILVLVPIVYFCYFWLAKPVSSTTVATRLAQGGTLVAFSGDDYRAREEIRKEIREEAQSVPGDMR